MSGQHVVLVTLWSGLQLVSQDPSDSKSNGSQVDIFRFPFNSFEVYSIDSSKMIGNSPEFSNFNQLFLKLNQLICNQLPVLLGHSSRSLLRIIPGSFWAYRVGQDPSDSKSNRLVACWTSSGSDAFIHLRYNNIL